MGFALRFCSLLALFWVFGSPAEGWGSGEVCRYRTWEWNTYSKRAENHREVRKLYADLTEEEKDPLSPCTVCESDQVWLRKAGLPPVRVCKHFRKEVEAVLERIAESGFPVYSIAGYRVGRSKGLADAEGLRTRFSLHSFGTAIDLNADRNGLYTDCERFHVNCRLIRGGPWYPDQPGSITRQSVVYDAFRKIGWRWGGELEGRQKDFMHFSLSGD